jgi:hypothetical protein
MRIMVETLVAAAPARVFAVAADVPRWPQIIAGISRIEMLTTGPVTTGTRFRETRTMFGREETQAMAVVEFVPPTRFVLAAESHGTRYRAEHKFLPVDGGTLLTLALDGVPETLVARLLAPLAWAMRGRVARMLDADLADLKRAAEG